MNLIQIDSTNVARVAPLVADFRVTLRGYKGIDSQPDLDDALEELLQVHITTMHVETNRIDALAEHLDCLGVGSLHIVNVDVLANLPVVVVASTANVRELTGE